MMRTMLLATLFGVIFSLSAQAAVYKCKVGTNVTFSQKPCPDTVIDTANPAAKIWKDMRELVKEGLRINQGIGADVESIKRCQADVAAYSQRLKKLEAPLAEVQLDNPYLVKAYKSLDECAVCRISSATYCKNADQFLDQAMNQLN